jgi:hypothetical protein
MVVLNCWSTPIVPARLRTTPCESECACNVCRSHFAVTGIYAIVGNRLWKPSDPTPCRVSAPRITEFSPLAGNPVFQYDPAVRGIRKILQSRSSGGDGNSEIVVGALNSVPEISGQNITIRRFVHICSAAGWSCLTRLSAVLVQHVLSSGNFTNFLTFFHNNYEKLTKSLKKNPLSFLS